MEHAPVDPLLNIFKTKDRNVVLNPFVFPVSGGLPTSGLILHLNGDNYDASTGTATDMSGSGNDATQIASGKRPSKISSAANGHAAMRFDGGDDYLGLTTSIPGTNTFSIFAAGNSTSLRQVFLGGGGVSGGIGSDGFFGINFTGPQFLFRDNSDSGLTVTSTSASSYAVYSGVNSSGSAEVWQNGVSIGTGSVGTFTGSVLGARYIIAAQGGAGDILAVLVYDNPLGTIDRQAVEAYLASMYGL